MLQQSRARPARRRRTHPANSPSSSSSCANVSRVASCAPVPASSSASCVGYNSRMTSRVLPSRSSNVTVVMTPRPHSFPRCHTMRCSAPRQVTAWKAIVLSGSSPNSGSCRGANIHSHDRRVMPGARHQHLRNSPGLTGRTQPAGASNGALTRSRSDVFRRRALHHLRFCGQGPSPIV